MLKLMVLVSGMMMATSSRAMATADTTVIWTLVDTLPLMNELRKRPHIISSQ